LLTERALKFIRDSKDETFFFYGAYALPHFSAREEDKHGLAVPSTDPYSDRDWDEKAKKYAAMIHMIDRDMGRIVDLVDELNIAENTLIIFTSDNGGHSTIPAMLNTSGPLRGFKRDLTEGGIRVPLIARWPGVVPAGQTSNEVIAFQDMLPTFAELAGTTAPDNLDGISITAALKGKILSHPHESLYWDYGHCRGKAYAQAVRMGDWKGIRRMRTGLTELYDLSKDIGERKNLAASHPEIVRKIGDLMDKAITPSPRYKIGTVYKGGAIWKKGH